VVMSTPIAIKDMDCSTCKAFEPIAPSNKLERITKGTCHRHAPIVSSPVCDAAPFPVVFLPEFCMEYIAKDYRPGPHQAEGRQEQLQHRQLEGQ